MAQELVDGMISVGIRAYDEPALPRVVGRAKEELARLGRTYEIVVVDDRFTVRVTGMVAGAAAGTGEAEQA